MKFYVSQEDAKKVTKGKRVEVEGICRGLQFGEIEMADGKVLE